MDTNATTPDAGGASFIGAIALIALFYFIPTVIAMLRRHRQAGPIAALNILLGWTVIGWIGSFIWSLTTPAPPQTIIVNQAPTVPAASPPVSPGQPS